MTDSPAPWHEDPNEELDRSRGRKTQTDRVIDRLLLGRPSPWVSKYDLITEIGTQASRRLQELAGDESPAKVYRGYRYFIDSRRAPSSERNEREYRLWRVVDKNGLTVWRDKSHTPTPALVERYEIEFAGKAPTLF